MTATIPTTRCRCGHDVFWLAQHAVGDLTFWLDEHMGQWRCAQCLPPRLPCRLTVIAEEEPRDGTPAALAVVRQEQERD